MQKAIFGFLVGLMLGGIGWFFIGRNDLGEIRRAYDTAYGDFQRVQRDISELGADSDGFAREISEISQSGRRITNRSESITNRVVGIDGEIRIIAGEVDQLEEWNRRSLQLSRDLGNVSFELRQLNKEGPGEE